MGLLIGQEKSGETETIKTLLRSFIDISQPFHAPCLQYSIQAPLVTDGRTWVHSLSSYATVHLLSHLGHSFPNFPTF